jgi:hypothetical protein
MDVMARNTIATIKKLSLAIYLVVPWTAHAAAEGPFVGELICSTGEPIKDAGVPQLTLPSISMELRCEFGVTGSGERATYTGAIKIAQVPAAPFARTFVWQVKAPSDAQNVTSLLAQKFDAQPRERNEPLIAVGQTEPKIKIQRLTDRTKDNELIMIEMHLRLLSRLT